MRRIVVAVFCASLTGAAQADRDYAITVYSSASPGAVSVQLQRARHASSASLPGYAMVRHDQILELGAGENEVRIQDVAALIDPTTVSFRAIDDPGARVLEQNFEFDLVSPGKLLQRYLDRNITVERKVGDGTKSLTGKLLSNQGGLVLQDEDGQVKLINDYLLTLLPALPGGLITKPTLVWRVATSEAGIRRVRIAYQTGGMSWWADYNLTLREHGPACTADIAAWVSIVNQSGAAYPGTRLKLIAGDVHRAPDAPRAPAQVARAMVESAAPPAFQEKAFFEYHLYTLGRRTDLANNSTKQIELFPTALDVSCRKELVYHGTPDIASTFREPFTDPHYGDTGNRKVDVFLGFANNEKNGLGIPLPAGRVRVNKLDPADQSLEFIGEDAIDHTPRNEQVRVNMGSAFDVVAQRRQTDFRIDTRGRWMEETLEIVVRNQKDHAVEVTVRENLYRWTNWTIRDSSTTFEQQDSRTIHFPLEVPPEDERRVSYTVRYEW